MGNGKDAMKDIKLTKPGIYKDSKWNLDWDTDFQPKRPFNMEPSSQIQYNLQLAVQYRDQLIADMADLIDQFAPDAILDTNHLLKSLESAERKVRTSENVGGDPARVTDYLRIRIIVKADDKAKSIKQIEDLRDEIMHNPKTTSYKDQFRRPCPEGGHRKFIANWQYGERENALKVEIQICHENMEAGPHEEAVKILRDCERGLAEYFKTEKALNLSPHALKQLQASHDFTQETRRFTNNECAKESGLNVLLDDEVRAAFEAPARPAKKQNLGHQSNVLQKPFTEAASKLPGHSEARGIMLTHLDNGNASRSDRRPNLH